MEATVDFVPSVARLLGCLALLVALFSFVGALGLFQTLRLAAYRRRLAQPTLRDIEGSTNTVMTVVWGALDAAGDAPALLATHREEIGIPWEPYVLAKTASYQSARRMMLWAQSGTTLLCFVGLLFIGGWLAVMAGVLLGALAAIRPLSAAGMNDVHKELADTAIYSHAWAVDDPASFAASAPRGLRTIDQRLTGTVRELIAYWTVRTGGPRNSP